jgi:hypothetical protein
MRSLRVNKGDGGLRLGRAGEGRKRDKKAETCVARSVKSAAANGVVTDINL